MRIFIIVDANELKEDGHGSKVVRGTRWSKYMKIVLVKKYIKIRFFLTKGSTYPPGGWGGVLRIYGFKASVPTFFMDLSPMISVLFFGEGIIYSMLIHYLMELVRVVQEILVPNR